METSPYLYFLYILVNVTSPAYIFIILSSISINISPYSFISADQMGILSPDASCKTLDAAANGYAKGEVLALLF